MGLRRFELRTFRNDLAYLAYQSNARIVQQINATRLSYRPEYLVWKYTWFIKFYYLIDSRIISFIFCTSSFFTSLNHNWSGCITTVAPTLLQKPKHPVLVTQTEEAKPLDLTQSFNSRKISYPFTWEQQSLPVSLSLVQTRICFNGLYVICCIWLDFLYYI